MSGLTDVTAVAAGVSHSLALKSDGTIWTWGENSSGQLGDGTETLRATPVQVRAGGLGTIPGFIAMGAGG